MVKVLQKFLQLLKAFRFLQKYKGRLYNTKKAEVKQKEFESDINEIVKGGKIQKGKKVE